MSAESVFYFLKRLSPVLIFHSVKNIIFNGPVLLKIATKTHIKQSEISILNCPFRVNSGSIEWS